MDAALERCRHAIVPAIAATFVIGYVVLTASVALTNYTLWASLVFAPVLCLVSWPLLLRAGHRDPDPRFIRLLVLAFVCKALATVARYLTAFIFYGGVADAAGYDHNGIRLAAFYRMGDFSAPIGRPLVGTGFIRVLTGMIYAVAGDSIAIAYAVFSWIGFWGLYFFYRAFRTAFPDGDHRRYAVLVMFLPSMLFWPSGLGKEAWMTLGLGLAAYGCALLLSGSSSRWVVPLLLGLTATALVRPHITAALAVAIPVAYLVGRPHRPATQLTPIIKVAAAGVLAVGTVVVLHQAASFLGLGALNVHDVNQAIDSTGARTSAGGSSFSSGGVRSPLDFPRAIVTVLFRPSLLDAHNLQLGIAALESTVLLLLVIVNLRRFRSVPVLLRSRPYLVVCLVYSAIFIYAFAHFANFGILVRERVQVIPFVLVLFALPVLHRGGAGREPFVTEVDDDRPISVPGKA